MALSNTATHKLSSNERFISYILEGLGGEGIWGYGIHRVRVMASNKKDDTAYPYAFTSMGFKSQDGELYICLRMNIDQNSPMKKRRLLPTSDGYALCGEMMNKLIDECHGNSK